MTGTPSIPSRRDFLSGAVSTVGAMSLAPGVLLIAPPPAKAAVSSKTRWGMLVDTTRCADGCRLCVDACKTENGWGGESKSNDRQAPQWIRKVSVHNPETGRRFSLPMMCQHCETPPCVDVCPTGASFKRADGIVLVDRHICIGCRYCMMACPYKARSFAHEKLRRQKPYMPRGKGTVEGCTFCAHRVDQNQLPACVETCDQGALTFGDLNDPNSDISVAVAKIATTRIRADLGLNQGVLYHGF